MNEPEKQPENSSDTTPKNSSDTAPTALADLEAIDATEIKGGPLVVAGEPLILNGNGVVPRTPLR